MNYSLQDGKTIAIISYITWVGTIIAFALNYNQRNSFASFHIRQTIGLRLLSVLNMYVLNHVAEPWLLRLISTGILVLLIIGLVGAIQGEERKIPFIGDLFQDWFKEIT